ncbi:YqiA/YcfP family alpha/beta fold hydrolase [Gilvimarinus sp. SDUM040013]|uniref:YqiA/YcfP family alpha/beta fold hydrolase n=1 Tax=Gilvimarinus gilvus TaxID=3058038 RepID=A0ABU4RV42_9GAMM|nr:YqiA/YcfP family alpha/beta fold hydrolase [Gilvimarinus sp. SDUM040013]MDO3387886.1 YqiA/YcfP family alpha/beta fold hydrolase [Gilvimarinus sp. SDUM040013]MDX6848743.1 YqiA/YcfP family alpha/beta fold hydrolase [Gilvimarinus sp. SDUM040013]
MACVIYVHGFLSSPLSHKAQVTKRWLTEHCPQVSFHCPHLTPYPAQTAEELDALIEFLQPEPIWLMGSSLGGFWATWLAERYNRPAVLINPSVAPWQFMPEFLGVDLKSYHTDHSYRLAAAHIDEIKAVDVSPVTRHANFWLMVQTGDETLDYRQAVAKYQGCRQLVEPDGDHGFVDFDQHLPAIFDFFQAFEATHGAR